MDSIKTTGSLSAGDKLGGPMKSHIADSAHLVAWSQGRTKTMERGGISTTIPGARWTMRTTADGPRGPVDGRRAAPTTILLAYKNASQHLTWSGIKMALGILKVASSQWKGEKKTRTDVAVKQLSAVNSSHPCKRCPLDHLAALVLQGEAERAPTKPQNCKRIVVLGAPRVGKTSILRRYLRDGFVEEYSPTSEDFLRKMFRIRGETYQIDVLDASAERDFPAKRRLSILTGDIFLLVFSLDERSSFEEVCALRMEIIAAKSKLAKSSVPEHCAQPQVALVVCANKADILKSEGGLSKAEVLQVLGDDCAYFETSAKESTNLEKVFETLAKLGGLPSETGPSLHRKLSIRSYQAMWAGREPGKGCQAAGRDEACGALYPLVRRPSFSTDLRHVIGSHSKRSPGKGLEKCQIQ
ncbi:GTP-binding protein Rhes [Spinachia spinachia]